MSDETTTLQVKNSGYKIVYTISKEKHMEGLEGTVAKC